MDSMEAAGGLITGGLIAKLLSRRESRRNAAAGNHPGVCSDCGAPVSGKYCSECGQPTHVHRSLLHLGEEVLHGVMHFDARIWRTLPLLAFNPGRLTREWVQGKRTRYVSPLAIFLFTVFLMFFIFSFFGGALMKNPPIAERIAAAEIELTEDRRDADAALSALYAVQRAAAAPGASSQTAAALEEARARFDKAANELAESAESARRLKAAASAGPRADGFEPGSVQAELADVAKSDRLEVNVGNSKFEEKLRHKLANPDLLFYKLQQTIYKFAFLLVPLSIPFVGLLFLWKRGFTWYDHGVFVLYSLTAMAILFMTMTLLSAGPAWLEIGSGFLMLAIPIHMFAQLKGAYGLSWFSATWRTIALLNLSAFVLIIFFLLILFLGFGG